VGNLGYESVNRLGLKNNMLTQNDILILEWFARHIGFILGSAITLSVFCTLASWVVVGVCQSVIDVVAIWRKNELEKWK